ncbi:MAG TPA: GxGYxYP family putative glycoside hydrolase [Sedimentisphaerales bacterium]|nr:GxGYxYP family putative glycoside hydrolase [Sedimentisphaerales bacterium]
MKKIAAIVLLLSNLAFADITRYTLNMAETHLDIAESTAAYCIQGLLNEKDDVLFYDTAGHCVTLDNAEKIWFDYLKQQKGLVFEKINTFSDLVKLAREKGLIKGLVVYEIKNGKVQQCIAENICVIDGYLPVTQKMLEYGSSALSIDKEKNCFNDLPINDITKKWPSDFDAQKWSVENQLPQFTKAGAFKDGGLYEYWQSQDYGIMRKFFFFNLDPRDATQRPLYDQIMSYLQAPAILTGGWHNEEGDVSASSMAGHYNVVTAGATNLSFWAHVKADPANLVMKQPSKNLTLDKSKYYVMFQASDGDAMRVLTSFGCASRHRGNKTPWLNNQRGSVPIAWGTQPLAAKLWPALLEYYKTTATANDSFFAGPSAGGYCYPNMMPNIEDVAKVFAGAFNDTALEVAEIWGSFDPQSLSYLKKHCTTIKCFTNKPQGTNGTGCNLWLPDGTAIEQSPAILWHPTLKSPDEIIERINKVASLNNPPYFITIYDIPRQTIKHALLAKEKLDSKFVIVGAEDFASLFQQAAPGAN